MATITAKRRAWLTESEHDQQAFVQAMHAGDARAAIEHITMGADGMEMYGWTFVGMAEVTLEVKEEDDIRQNMVVSLREKKKTVLARAQKEATEIDEKIQNLLAISFDEGAR